MSRRSICSPETPTTESIGSNMTIATATVRIVAIRNDLRPAGPGPEILHRWPPGRPRERLRVPARRAGLGRRGRWLPPQRAVLQLLPLRPVRRPRAPRGDRDDAVPGVLDRAPARLAGGDARPDSFGRRRLSLQQLDHAA